MAKTYLIGVDLGTMGTKAAIFDTEGNLVALAFEESKLLYPKPSRKPSGFRSVITDHKEASPPSTPFRTRGSSCLHSMIRSHQTSLGAWP